MSWYVTQLLYCEEDTLTEINCDHRRLIFLTLPSPQCLNTRNPRSVVCHKRLMSIIPMCFRTADVNEEKCRQIKVILLLWHECVFPWSALAFQETRVTHLRFENKTMKGTVSHEIRERKRMNKVVMEIRYKISQTASSRLKEFESSDWSNLIKVFIFSKMTLFTF